MAPIPPDVRARLDACSARLLLLRDEERAEQERRNDLVRQAVDEGLSFRQAGRVARLSVGYIARIVAGDAV